MSWPALPPLETERDWQTQMPELQMLELHMRKQQLLEPPLPEPLEMPGPQVPLRPNRQSVPPERSRRPAALPAWVTTQLAWLAWPWWAPDFNRCRNYHYIYITFQFI
jgi:hypothetical protein